MSQSDDEALGDLADAYREIGRTGEALLLYRRARDLDPDDSEWTDAVRALESIRKAGEPAEAQGEPPASD